MWEVTATTVIILIASTMASDGESKGDALAMPQNLTVENISSTAATLRWEFADPRNVSLQNVVFRIVMRYGGTHVKLYETRQSETPLQFSLTSLEPKTRYSVGVYAGSTGFGPSPVREVSFLTLDHDTFNPSISDELRNDLADFDSCEVLWTATQNKETPGYKEIELCNPHCSDRVVFASSDEAFTRLKPDLPHLVKITAVFERSYIPNRYMVLERGNNSLRFKVEDRKPGSGSILQMKTLVDSEMWEVAAAEAAKLDLKADAQVKMIARFCFEDPHNEAHLCRNAGQSTASTDIEGFSPFRSLRVRRDRLGCLNFDRDVVPGSSGPTNIQEISVKGKLGVEINANLSETDRRHMCDPLGANFRVKDINVSVSGGDTLNTTANAAPGSVGSPVTAAPSKKRVVRGDSVSVYVVLAFIGVLVLWMGYLSRSIDRTPDNDERRVVNRRARPNAARGAPALRSTNENFKDSDDLNRNDRNDDVDRNPPVSEFTEIVEDYDIDDDEDTLVPQVKLTLQPEPEIFRKPKIVESLLRHGGSFNRRFDDSICQFFRKATSKDDVPKHDASVGGVLIPSLHETIDRSGRAWNPVQDLELELRGKVDHGKSPTTLEEGKI